LAHVLGTVAPQTGRLSPAGSFVVSKLSDKIAEMHARALKQHHLQEVRQLGFGLDFQSHRHLSWDERLAVVRRVIDFLHQGETECKGVLHLGSDFGFAVCRRGHRSATEADRARVEHWLQAQPEIVSYTVGPLVEV
jgi:uncharacterized protein YggL (DUF469 family)